MADVMLFQFVGNTVDTALNTYVQEASGKVIIDFTFIAITATALLYTFNGYMLIIGKGEQSAEQFFVSMGKFLLISAFAMSATNYLHWVVSAINGLETGITAAFSLGTNSDPTNVYQVVDSSITKGWNLAADLWDKAGNAGITHIGMAIGQYIEAFIIALATIIIALPAGAMIIVAKAVLSLMLGIGPLFIMLLMWGPTRAFFDRWFSVVVTAILQIALLAAVLSFAIKAFMAFVNPIDLDNSQQNPLFASLELLVVAFIMMYVLYRVNDYAAQLGGGLSSQAITFGQMLGRASGMVNAPNRAGRVANDMLNPMTTRRDLESGMMVTARRFNHLAAGNTVVNPAYRQHVMENLTRNWGRKRGGKVNPD